MMKRPTLTVLEHWPSLGGLESGSSAVRMARYDLARDVVNRLVPICFGVNRCLETKYTTTVGAALLTPLLDVATATNFVDILCVNHWFRAAYTGGRFATLNSIFTLLSLC